MKPIKIVRGTLLLAVGLCLLGCAAGGVPEPKAVPLNITASPELNPHADGQAQSVDVLFYCLTSPSKFSAAGLTELYPPEQSAATLGGDLVDTQLVRVSPGAQQSRALEVDPRTRYLGVVVAFEQYQRANWRSVVQLRDEGALDRVMFRNKKLNIILASLDVVANLE